MSVFVNNGEFSFKKNCVVPCPGEERKNTIVDYEDFKYRCFLSPFLFLEE